MHSPRTRTPAPPRTTSPLPVSHCTKELLSFQTSQLVAQAHSMKQPALSRKRSGIATFAVTSISAEPLPNQKSSQEKNKNHDMALKTSALNTHHTALSTIIPLPPNPPYLTRTHVKNSPVGVIHFRARISARPDPALRAASVPKGKLWSIISVSSAWALVIFFQAHPVHGLRAGMKLFGS